MKTLDIAGHRVDYLDKGQGEIVLLSHSTLNSSTQWRKLVESFALYYRLLAIDRFGHGGSDGWTGEALTYDREAEPLRVLLRDIDAPVHLVAHSYGAASAFNLVLEAPEKFSSVTMFEPVRFALLEFDDDMTIRDEVDDLCKAYHSALGHQGHEAAARLFFSFWNSREEWELLRPDQQQRMTDLAVKIGQEFGAILADTATPEDFKRIETPVLLITGDVGPDAGRRPSEILANLLPNSELVTVRGAAHMGMITHAEQINPLVRGQLELHARVELES